MVKTSECFKAHPMLHSLLGLGVGLILVALLPDLVDSAMVLGVVLVVVSFAAHYMIK